MTFFMNPTNLAMCIGLLIFFVIIFVAFTSSPKKINLLDRLNPTEAEQIKLSLERENISSTRYGNFHKKHLNKIFDKTTVNSLSARFKINQEDVQQQIIFAKMENEITVTELVSMKALGYVGAIFFVVLFFMFQSFLFLVLAVSAYGIGAILPQFTINKKVAIRKQEIVRNLPDYIELLYTVLDAGCPLFDAILTISGKVKNVVGDEFLEVMSRTQITNDWKKEMEEMAKRNNVDALTDLVADILIAYEKGTSIIEVLKEDASHIRKLKIASVMEEAKKLTVKLLIPIALFCFLPLMIIIVGPMAISIFTGL